MKLFLYYTFCSVKNQIKKLCKTWFVIFLLACMIIGGIIGMGFGMVLDIIDGEEPDTEIVDPVPPSGGEEELPEEPMPELTMEEKIAFAECVVCGLFIIFMFLAAFGADKSGSAIFTMADVNLLFPSPRKPQSVLLFKLMSQILLGVFLSVYFVFQIPMISELGYSLFAIVMMLVAFAALFAYQKLFNIMLYTLCSTRPGVKRYLRPACFAVLGVLCAVYFIIYRSVGDPLLACKTMFTSRVVDFIPVLGWINGIVSFAEEGKILYVIIYLVLIIAGAVALAFGVWSMKADFYEEALIKSQEMEEIRLAAQSNTVAKRSKDRSERIRERAEFNRGSGASVFFFKEMHNRRRFSHFGILTKTSEFYIVVALLVSAVVRFAAHSNSILPLGFALAVMAFWRAMGNPLAADMAKDCFVTIPAPAHEKVLWSLLAGSVSCALDCLPALVLGALFVGADPLVTLALFVLIISVDYYASNVMLFIELSLPSSLALQLKQAISIMFIYFGIAPIAGVLLVGFVFGLIDAFILIASAFAIAVGSLFFAFSPLFISKGRK